jgi:hypothetical protein
MVLPKTVDRWWEVVLALEAIPPSYWKECSKHLIEGGRAPEAVERCRSEHKLHNRPRARPALIRAVTFAKGYRPMEIRKLLFVSEYSDNVNRMPDYELEHEYINFGGFAGYISSTKELEQYKPIRGKVYEEDTSRIVREELKNKAVRKWAIRELKAGRILALAYYVGGYDIYTDSLLSEGKIVEVRIISLPGRCVEDNYRGEISI